VLPQLAAAGEVTLLGRKYSEVPWRACWGAA